MHACQFQALKWGCKQVEQSGAGRVRSGRRGAPRVPSGLATYSAGGMGGSKDAPHFESSFHGRLAGASGRAVSKVHEPKRVDCAGCLQLVQGLHPANSSQRSSTSQRATNCRKMPTINVDKYALFEELGEQ